MSGLVDDFKVRGLGGGNFSRSWAALVLEGIKGAKFSDESHWLGTVLSRARYESMSCQITSMGRQVQRYI